MEINDIISIIGSLGFPIAACIFMFKQNSKLGDTLNDLSKTLTLMNERIKNIEDKVDEIGEEEK